MDQTSILIRPVITEKSMDEAGRGRFTFIVAKEATKAQVRKAVEEQFKVNVISAQTLIVKGKPKRVGKKRVTLKPTPFKKAIVGLKEGQHIEFFEIQKQEETSKASKK